MPVIGSFHNRYWKARANGVIPPGPAVSWIYPQVQSVVSSGLAVVVFGPPLHLLRQWGRQAWAWMVRARHRLRWAWRVACAVWRWRVWAERIEARDWTARLDTLDLEQRAVLERVVTVLQGPAWASAQREVRACATSPKFHQPEQWVDYSRTVKKNAGHAQNIWRHMKVVYAIQADQPVSNPDAHLAAELAYQGFATMGRPRRVEAHPILNPVGV